jgi:acyl carrier protein
MVTRSARPVLDGAIRALGDDEALALFDLALTAAGSPGSTDGDDVLVPIRFNEGYWLDGHAPVPALLSALVRPPAHVPDTVAAAEPGLWRRLLADTAPPQRRERLETLVRDELAALLGYRDPETLTGRRFTDLGFDSLAALRTRSLLVDRTGIQLPADLMFAQPTLDDLCDAVDAALTADGAYAADPDTDTDTDTDRTIQEGVR